MLENPTAQASLDAAAKVQARILRDLASLSLATSKLLLEAHCRAARGEPLRHPWFLENIERNLRLAHTNTLLATNGVADALDISFRKEPEPELDLPPPLLSLRLSE